jgi:hypothetical protein
MNITVKYGIDQINKHFSNDSATISDLTTDYEVRSALGYGDNVRALINGVEQPGHALIPDGAIIVIETRANSKALLQELQVVSAKLEEVIDNAAALIDRIAEIK